jgi:hypothetical protein
MKNDEAPKIGLVEFCDSDIERTSGGLPLLPGEEEV